MVSTTLQKELDTRVSKLPFYERVFSSMLRRYLPQHMKRMIFLSSIAGMMNNVHAPDELPLIKLNAALKLANGDNALKLPIYVRSWLWKDYNQNPYVQLKTAKLTIQDIPAADLNPTDFLYLAKNIIAHSRLWLVYDSGYVIAKDLETLVKDFMHADVPSPTLA